MSRRHRLHIRHPVILSSDVNRWREFANCALHSVTDGLTTPERLRGLLKLSGTLRPVGDAGDLNPCVRLREEVARLVDTKPMPGRMRNGLDAEAWGADNSGEVERFAREVLARCQSFRAVHAAERRL